MENYLIEKKVEVGIIATNFAELKKQIDTEMARFKEHLTSLENIKDTKADLATLRKFKKEMNDHRKSIIEAYDEPVKAFKKEYDSLMASVLEAEQKLDEGIKEIEELEKTKRMDEAKAIVDDMLKDEPEDVVAFVRGIPKFINPSWENKTFWDRKDAVRKDVADRLKTAKTALTLFINHKHSAQLLDNFAQTFDIDNTVDYQNYLDEADRKAEELKAIRETRVPVSTVAPSEEKHEEQEPIVGINLLVKGKQSLINAVLAYIEKHGLEYINRPIK